MDVEFENQEDLAADDVADLWLKNAKKRDDDEEEDGDEAEAPESDEEEAEEPDPEEDGEESDDEEDESEEEAPRPVDDDADVAVTVDGKELKVKVKDLKRLYGQEASLTQKSQAVSAQARTIETQSLYLAKVIESRMNAAQARVDKFKDVDLFKAARELSPDDFDALNSAKKAAEAEIAVLNEEAKSFMTNAMNTRKDMLREQAKVAIVELKKSIPEWNDDLYSKIRTYAVGQGMDRDTVNEIVDPGAITLIHKAMLYDAAKTKTDTVAKKLIKSPKKALSKSDKVTDSASNRVRVAKKLAIMSGDVDDVAAAWLASKK